jgi:hypothetical protein
MRNNEERFGHSNEDDGSSTIQNLGLDFVSPTEFVDLPSKGKFYPSTHPLYNKEEVEIKFMTAKEEDILTNKSLLRKGVAIDRMLQSLLVQDGLKLDTMLTGDKNAVLLASRISAYGEDYKVSVTCPSCEERQKVEIDLTSFDVKEVDDEILQEVQQTERGTFIFSLPRSKMQVEFRLLTAGDESEIAQELIKKKETAGSSIKQMKRVVVSVNGETNPSVVTRALENMIASDARSFRNAIRGLTPDVDMKQHFNCESCGHDEDMEVPLTAEFFWPK